MSTDDLLRTIVEICSALGLASTYNIDFDIYRHIDLSRERDQCFKSDSIPNK